MTRLFSLLLLTLALLSLAFADDLSSSSASPALSSSSDSTYPDSLSSSSAIDDSTPTLSSSSTYQTDALSSSSSDYDTPLLSSSSATDSDSWQSSTAAPDTSSPSPTSSTAAANTSAGSSSTTSTIAVTSSVPTNSTDGNSSWNTSPTSTPANTTSTASSWITSATSTPNNNPGGSGNTSGTANNTRPSVSPLSFTYKAANVTSRSVTYTLPTPSTNLPSAGYASLAVTGLAVVFTPSPLLTSTYVIYPSVSTASALFDQVGYLVPNHTLAPSYSLSSLSQLNSDLSTLVYQLTRFVSDRHSTLRLFNLSVSIFDYATLGIVGTTYVEVDLTITPAAVSTFWQATNATTPLITAGQTASLANAYALTSDYVTYFNGTDAFSVVLSAEAGSLSVVQLQGSMAQVTAAMATVMFTAPLLFPPSASYASGDAHYIGALWNVSVVLIEADVTDALNRTFRWVVPVQVALINQAPTISVANPSALAKVYVAYPTYQLTSLPLAQANVTFADVDGYGGQEMVTVTSTLGGQVCYMRPTGETGCWTGTASYTNTLAVLSSLPWFYQPPSTLSATANVSDTIIVTLYDMGHSGNAQLYASINFTLYLVPQPAAPALYIAPVAVGQVNSSSVAVAFPAYTDPSPVNPPIAYYLISYYTSANWWSPAVVNVTATSALSYSVRVGGLSAATLYFFSLTAGNALGTSGSSWVPGYYANLSYPVTTTACGTAQYCGAQWTLPIPPKAPSVSITSDVGLSVVTIGQPANTSVMATSYTLSYAQLTSGTTGAWSSQTLSANGLVPVNASLVNLALSSTFIVQVTGYSSFFNVYGATSNTTLTTLAAPPAITSFSIADPNNTATASNWNAYRAGLVFTLTFAAPIALPVGATSVARSQFVFSMDVGTVSDFVLASPTTLTATVVKVGSNPQLVQLGLLTVTPQMSAQITAVSPASYSVESTSPKLTGSFGSYNFGSSALGLIASPTTTNAADVLLSSVIAFTGAGSNYSYVLTIVTPPTAYFTSTNSSTPLSTFTYGAAPSSSPSSNSTSPSITGGALTDVIASIDSMLFYLPMYYAGVATFRVDALTLLNGTFVVTATALGQVTVPPVYHTPVIQTVSRKAVADVTTQSRPLTALFPGLALYDVDADPVLNAFADITSLYTVTVSWATAVTGSYLAFAVNVTKPNSTVIINPDWSSIAALQASQGGVSTLTAYASLPALQSIFSQLTINTFPFDASMSTSVLSISLASPHSMSTAVNLTVTQNIASVPAAIPTDAYLMPSMTSFVLILDSTVSTALATSGAKFAPAALIANTSAFGAGAACQYLASDPITSYVSGLSSTASVIQCTFGTGATFTIDPSTSNTTSMQLVPELQVLNGTSVLQRVPGGMNNTQYIHGNVAVISLTSVYGTPSFSLSGSPSLSFCDNQTLTLTAIVASQGVGFGTTYRWTVSDTGINNALVAAGLTSSGSLVVPHIERYFSLGSSYRVSLTVTNLVGLSSTQSLTVSRASSPAPILLGSSVQSNSITDLILLSFTPQLPGACFSASSAILYSWTAINNSVVLDPFTTSTSTLGFSRPYLANGLSYGKSYTFQLTASLSGINSSAVSRTITLSINDLSLSVGIAGPSVFQAGAGAPLRLTTVGATVLPTQAQQVTYTWSCTTAAGRACVALDGVTPVPAVASQTGAASSTFPLTIAGNTLAPTTTPYTFTASVAVDGGAAQTASVQVYLIAGTPVAINVTAIRGATTVQGSVVVNDYNKLTLSASSSAGANATYTWTCVACPASFTLNPNTSNTANLVLNPSATAGYWTPLATYQFRVSVVPTVDASSASFSSIVVSVNSPPAPPATGAISVVGPQGVGQTLAGYANGVDQWTVSVAQTATQQSGWTGTGVLTYQFYFVDATGSVNFLSSATTALSNTAALPLGWGVNGSLPVGVVVYDSVGGQTSQTTDLASSPLITLQKDVSASQLLSNLLNSSANLSPSAFLSAVVSLASAATAIASGSSDSSSNAANSTAALAQRVQLLSLISANIASVSSALGLQAVGSVVGGGAVSDPAALSQAASVLATLLTNALSDPSFSSTPLQLSNFFKVIFGLMSSNHQAPTPTTPSRRLLSAQLLTGVGSRLATQDVATADFAQALRAASSNFLGSASAPASQVIPPTTTAPGVYRAGVTQGVVAPFTVTLAGVSATLTAGAGWLQSNVYGSATAFDFQVGLLSPDPYVGLVNATNGTSFAGYTMYFDVVDVSTGASESAFTWTNATGAPTLTFYTSNSSATNVSAAATQLSYQCLQWSDADGYDNIPTSGPDSTGALSCYPTKPGTSVTYSTTPSTLNEIVPPISTTASSSSTGGGFLNQYAFLFSGYNGSHPVGGYYFWMAVSIALCLLFPVFVLTYTPAQQASSLNATAKNAAPIPTSEAAAGAAAVPAHTAVDMDGGYPSAADAGEGLGGARQARSSTIDAGTLDFVDVKKLKSAVYQNEEKMEEQKEDGSESAGQDDVGFVVHQ